MKYLSRLDVSLEVQVALIAVWAPQAMAKKNLLVLEGGLARFFVRTRLIERTFLTSEFIIISSA